MTSWSQLAKVGSSSLEHQVQPLAEDAVHVADVAGVLQRRPGLLVGPLGRVRAGAARPPSPSRRRAAAGRGRRGRGRAATNPHSGQGSRGPRSSPWCRARCRARCGLDHGHIIMEPVTVRSADPADLPRIAAIYDEQVRTAISTFDLEPPAAGLLGGRLASTEPGDHLLVADSPDGDVVGYAYSSSYRPRPAYARTREVSVYLDDVGARAGPRPAAVRRAARPAARRRRAPGAGRDRAAERRERGAAPACGFARVGLLPEVGLEVRPLDRHRALGAHAGVAATDGASGSGDLTPTAVTACSVVPATRSPV